MKDKIRNVLFISLILGLAGLFSCDDDMDMIDVTAPSIEVKAPHEGEFLLAGEYLQFEATLTDDLELATYNLEIHENFSGHAHGRIAGSQEDPSLLKWSFKESYIIPAGLIIYQAIHEDDILIPTNTIAGPYHFIVQAIDASGNATNFQDDSAVEMEVYITNDSQPVINITNLENEELDLEVGVVFMVEGDVTDPTIGEYAGMHAIDIVLGEGDHDHSHDGRVAEDDLIDAYFKEEELDQFMVDGAIILDKVFENINFSLTQDQLDELIAEEIDHLLLSIKVFDEQGNIAVSNTDVHIHMD